MLTFFRLSLLIIILTCFFQEKGVIAIEKASPNGALAGDALERQRAVLKLVLKTFDDNTFNFLIKSLKDPDPFVRYAAAWVMKPFRLDWVLNGEFNSSAFKTSQLQEAINSLLESLRDEDPWVRVEVLERLSEIEHLKKLRGLELDNDVKETFVTHAKHPDPYERSTAIRSLDLWKKDPDIQRVINKALKDEIWVVRYSSFMTDGINFETLTEAIKEENPNSRVRVIMLLKTYFLEDPRTLPILIERLHDPNGQVVFESIHGLAILKDPRAIEPLLDLAAAEPGWQGNVKKAIEEITAKPFDDVSRGARPGRKMNTDRKPMINFTDISKSIEKLKSGDLYERISAGLQLTWSKAPEAVDALIEALQDKEPRVRYAAVQALGEFSISSSRQQEKVVEALLKAAEDGQPHVRRIAVQKIIAFSFLDKYQERLTAFLSSTGRKEKDPLTRFQALSNPPVRDGIILKEVLKRK